MSADYDKYEPYANGFRALLNADHTDSAKFGIPVGVGINANGRLVVGGGQTGIVGVMIINKKKKAGAVQDTMTSGEITGFDGTAGTKYYADPTTGAISATNGTGKVYVGFTVEKDRLVVRTAANFATPA
ncbi:minor capsid protein [Gordonia phage DumpTruck]|nr:minor capsid protein [Gordonia phage DumpTruck]